MATTYIRSSGRKEGDSCEDFGLTFDLVMAQTGEIAKHIHGNRTQSNLHDLASTIETAIIPRLLLLHGGASGAPAPVAGMNDLSPAASSLRKLPENVDSFIGLTLAQDNSQAFNYLEERLNGGTAVESLMLDVLAPAARSLGEMWEADLLSFVDVTLGLSRIQQLLRQLHTTSQGRAPLEATKGRALLVPAPGEQHTFGLRVVEEFLLRDGWDVRSDLTADADEILRLVSDEDYVFVGFSLSGHRLLPALQSAIGNIRKYSRNRSIRVMVGGVYFAERPDAVQEIDADVAIADAVQAVEKANEWHQPPQVN